MVIKLFKSKNFRLVALILFLAIANMAIEVVYPRSFIERFNSIAAYYQTDKFVRDYISSENKGNVLFIGGSSLFSALSMKHLNLTAKSMGLDEFRAQALFMSGETAESQILFIENVLNDFQVKFLIVDSVRMELSPMPLNYHDATFFSFSRNDFYLSHESINKFFSMFLITLNSLVTRMVPIRVDYHNSLSKVESENFGQSIKVSGGDSSAQAGSAKDILWRYSSLPRISADSFASNQIKRFFSACEKRNIVPILMIQNRHSKEVRGEWIAEYWATFSNFPILYAEPSTLETKLGMDYHDLFQDKSHFTDVSREKFTRFFSPAFLELTFPGSGNAKYGWWASASRPR